MLVFVCIIQGIYLNNKYHTYEQIFIQIYCYYAYVFDYSLNFVYNLREMVVFKGMRDFNYSKIRDQKWDSDILAYIAAIYKEMGKQEQYLKQRSAELEKLVEIAKIQSTEASNAIEGIVTTNTRIKQLVEEKTTPRNRDEQEIAGYRDVLNIIHDSFDTISVTLANELYLPA